MYSRKNVDASTRAHAAIHALPKSIAGPLLSVTGVLLADVNQEPLMTQALESLAEAAVSIHRQIDPQVPDMFCSICDAEKEIAE